MKFIDYIDENGTKNIVDAERVMFTMTIQDGPVDEFGKVQKTLTKVALNENMGFILSIEEPDAIVSRIKDALGVG